MLSERAFGARTYVALQATFEADVAPHLSDPIQRAQIRASVQYGVHLFAIIDAAWRAMAQGYLMDNGESCGAGNRFSGAALSSALSDYDAGWAAYRAYGLGNVYAP